MKFGALTLLTLALALALAGCGTTPNPASCVDNHCSDPDRPFCDKDGSIGGEPNTCIAVSCAAGVFERCTGDAALKCNSAGTNYEQTDCEFGCSEGAGGCQTCNTSECERHIIPRFLPAICNDVSNSVPGSFSTQVLDTSNDFACDSIVPQTNAPEICVVRGSAFTIPANVTLSLTGTRVFALVADQDIFVEGTLDASASGLTAGPGGSFVKSGTMDYPNGGGGAGFMTQGGHGGSVTMDGGAANGGPGTDVLQQTRLIGGPRPELFNGTEYSGGGGGGITLISCRGTVRVTGLIDVGGGGGDSGGGGAGGYGVLQGINVHVFGRLFANGGGGGGGLAGEDGSRSSTLAARGGLSVLSFGAGGYGGIVNLPPGNGAKANDPAGAGGGGGGSTGFFLVAAPQNGIAEVAPQEASPSIATETIGANR